MKLFQEMVFTSFLCGGLILLICAVNKAVGHRYQRMWRYYLWILIGIRLLIPFDFSVAEAPVSLETEKIYQFVDKRKDDLPVNGKEKNTYPDSQQLYNGSGADGKIIQRTELWEILLIVWLLGSGIIVLYVLIGYLVQKRRIWCSVFPIMDYQIRKLWKKMSAKAGIRENIPVYKCSIIHSPMVTGLWNKRLLLPEREFEEDELMYIFRHELQHLKHHDIWIKMIYLSLCAVYWFQPAVWLMKKEMDKDLEALCDTRAVRGFKAAERYSYTQTMIRCMIHKNEMYMPVSSGFGGDVKTMKERIRLIMEGNKLKKGFGIFSMMVLLMAAGMFLVSCGSSGKAASDSEQVNAAVLNETDQEKKEESEPQEKEDESSAETEINAEDEIAFTETDNSSETGSDGQQKIAQENQEQNKNILNQPEQEEGSETNENINAQTAGAASEINSSVGVSDNLQQTDGAAKPECHFEIPEEWSGKVGVWYGLDTTTIYYNQGLKEERTEAYQTIFTVIRYDENADLQNARGFCDRFDILGTKDGYTFVLTQPTDTALEFYDEAVWEDIKFMMSDQGVEPVKNSFTIQS